MKIAHSYRKALVETSVIQQKFRETKLAARSQYSSGKAQAVFRNRLKATRSKYIHLSNFLKELDKNITKANPHLRLVDRRLRVKKAVFSIAIIIEI